MNESLMVWVSLAAAFAAIYASVSAHRIWQIVRGYEHRCEQRLQTQLIAVRQRTDLLSATCVQLDEDVHRLSGLHAELAPRSDEAVRHAWKLACSGGDATELHQQGQLPMPEAELMVQIARCGSQLPGLSPRNQNSMAFLPRGTKVA